MPELEFEVEPYQVSYGCDSCGSGWMVPAYPGLDSFTKVDGKVQVIHKCNSCGAVQNLDHAYPVIRYRYVKSRPSGIQDTEQWQD